MVMAAPRVEPLVTAAQVAHRMQCSPKSVRNWVHARRIPHLRVGPRGLLRFRLSAVENALAVEVPAAPPPAPPKPPKPDGGSSSPPT